MIMVWANAKHAKKDVEDSMPRSNQITLKQLLYFSRVVDAGSISRASEDLHIAQTALGLQVRALEECIGVSLLLRHPKGVQPTSEGKYVYEQAQKIIGSVDAMAAEVLYRSGAKPRDVWLGLVPSIMRAIGVQAVVSQEKELPGIRLHLVEMTRSGLLEAVRTKELDWAIVHEAEDADNLFTFPLLGQSLVLVSRPGTGLLPGSIRLRDVLKRDLVLDSGKRVMSGVLSKAVQGLGMKANIRFEIDSVSAIKQMILQEDVSGLLNREIVAEEVERGELEVHEIIDPSLDVTAYFVARSAEMPKARDLPILRFIDLLLDEYFASAPCRQVRLNRLESVIETQLVD